MGGNLLDVASEKYFKGARSGKERVTIGEKRETCHYAKWACTLKEKHGILGQGEMGGEDCLLSVCRCARVVIRHL